MGVWDYIIIGLIALAVAGAVAGIIRNRKRGKGCCADCSKCAGCAYKQK